MFLLKIYKVILSRNTRELDLFGPLPKLMYCSVMPQRAIKTQNNGEKSLSTQIDSETSEPSFDNTALEDEIEKMRNKHRLPDRVYRIHIQKEVPKPEMKHDFKKRILIRHYGRYGKSSELNPGLMWPTQEELNDITEYEQKYTLSMSEMLQNIHTKKAERERAKKDYEHEIYKKMDNLDKTMSDYYAKIAKRQETANELKKKRELLIEEISEYLGYDVNPEDPKFKEVVDLKQKEKKKAMKAQREKDSYARMIKKLSDIAQESKEEKNSEES